MKIKLLPQKLSVESQSGRLGEEKERTAGLIILASATLVTQFPQWISAVQRMFILLGHNKIFGFGIRINKEPSFDSLKNILETSLVSTKSFVEK